MRSVNKTLAPKWAKLSLAASVIAFASGLMIGCAEQNSRERVITRSGQGAGPRSQRLAQGRDGQGTGARDGRAGRPVTAEQLIESVGRISQGTALLPSEIAENSRFQLTDLSFFHEESGDQGAKVLVQQTAVRNGSSARFNQPRIQMTREFTGANAINFSTLIPNEISRVAGTDLNAWATDAIPVAIESNARRITSLVMSRAPISNVFDAQACALSADSNKALACDTQINDQTVRATVTLRQVSNTNLTIEIKFQADRQPSRTFIASYQIVQ